MTDDRNTPSEIIDFWFSAPICPLWFHSTPEFDRELAQRYGDIYRMAAAGQLRHWAATPEGALALVIILDQFPLNIFRGQREAYATETDARNIAMSAINAKFDQSLPDEQRAFLYLPFMHSENLADQDYSVALYQAAGLEHNLAFARHHRELIRRFGRFPHRNAILKRVNTVEERAYLASEEAFLG